MRQDFRPSLALGRSSLEMVHWTISLAWRPTAPHPAGVTSLRSRSVRRRIHRSPKGEGGLGCRELRLASRYHTAKSVGIIFLEPACNVARWSAERCPAFDWRHSSAKVRALRVWAFLLW